MSITKQIAKKNISTDEESIAPEKSTLGSCSEPGHTGHWLDVYGGGPHCLTCKPPPSPKFVKRRISRCEGQWLSEHEAWERQDEIELAEKIESLTEVEKKMHAEKKAKRLAAGESEAGVGWRALVDVRLECGHWGQ